MELVQGERRKKKKNPRLRSRMESGKLYGKLAKLRSAGRTILTARSADLRAGVHSEH